MLGQRFLLIYALLAVGLVANAAPSQPPAKDLHGDPLPAGAVARLGMDRWGHDSCIFAAFLPDGKRVVTVSPDRTIRVWEFPSGKELNRITPPAPDNKVNGNSFGGFGSGPLSFYVGPGSDGGRADEVALSKDGKTIAIGGTEIYLCDLTTGKELVSLKWVSRANFNQKIGGSAVARLAFSPNSEHLASITEDGAIRIWDWAKANEVDSFAGADRTLDSVELIYAPDGKSIATRTPSAGKKQQGPGPDVLKLWDLATRTEKWTLRPDSGVVGAVAFSLDGKSVAFTGGLDKPIILVDAATGKEIGTMGNAKEARQLSSLVFAKDGRKLYASAWNSYLQSELTEWDIASGKLLRKFAMPYAAQGISLSPDENTVVVAGALEFLDLAGGKDITVRTGATTALSSVQFTPDGKNLFTTRFARSRLGSESLHKWDAVTGKDLGPVSLPVPLAGIALSPDGKVLAGRQFNADYLVDRRGPYRFVLVDVASGKELGQTTVSGAAATMINDLNINFSPDGTILAVNIKRHAKESKVELYDVPAAKPRLTLDIQNNYNSLAVFSHDSKTMASYADFGFGRTLTLGLWDTTIGRRIDSVALPQSLSGSAMYVRLGTLSALTPDGRCLAVDMGAVGSGRLVKDETVALVELATGQMRTTFGKTPHGVHGRRSFPAISPDGKTLAGAGHDGTVYLWDMANSKELAAFKGHRGAVNAVVFARDGKTVASAGADGTALIWDVTKIARPAPTAKALTPADLETCWQALAETDAVKAWAAMGDLVAVPKDAVTWIKDRVKPVPPLDMKRVQALIKQLDDANFTMRDKASGELLKFGDTLVPTINKALSANPSLESKRRLEDLRGRVVGTLALQGERLRGHRAVEVLELIGTPTARQVLQTLADGAPGALVTISAQSALKR